jgi:hypothetical protein
MGLSYKRDKKLNWHLMYLPGNYCDSDNSCTSPGVFLLRFKANLSYSFAVKTHHNVVI